MVEISKNDVIKSFIEVKDVAVQRGHLKVGDDGLVHKASRISYVWNVIKGALGGTNRCDVIRVEYALLRQIDKAAAGEIFSSEGNQAVLRQACRGWADLRGEGTAEVLTKLGAEKSNVNTICAVELNRAIEDLDQQSGDRLTTLKAKDVFEYTIAQPSGTAGTAAPQPAVHAAGAGSPVEDTGAASRDPLEALLAALSAEPAKRQEEPVPIERVISGAVERTAKAALADHDPVTALKVMLDEGKGGLDANRSGSHDPDTGALFLQIVSEAVKSEPQDFSTAAKAMKQAMKYDDKYDGWAGKQILATLLSREADQPEKNGADRAKLYAAAYVNFEQAFDDMAEVKPEAAAKAKAGNRWYFNAIMNSRAGGAQDQRDVYDKAVEALPKIASEAMDWLSEAGAEDMVRTYVEACRPWTGGFGGDKDRALAFYQKCAGLGLTSGYAMPTWLAQHKAAKEAPAPGQGTEKSEHDVQTSGQEEESFAWKVTKGVGQGFWTGGKWIGGNVVNAGVGATKWAGGKALDAMKGGGEGSPAPTPASTGSSAGQVENPAAPPTAKPAATVAAPAAKGDAGTAKARQARQLAQNLAGLGGSVDDQWDEYLENYAAKFTQLKVGDLGQLYKSKTDQPWQPASGTAQDKTRQQFVGQEFVELARAAADLGIRQYDAAAEDDKKRIDGAVRLLNFAVYLFRANGGVPNEYRPKAKLDVKW